MPDRWPTTIADNGRNRPVERRNWPEPLTSHRQLPRRTAKTEIASIMRRTVNRSMSNTRNVSGKNEVYEEVVAALGNGVLHSVPMGGYHP